MVIVTRANGGSAVGKAAYQSGEQLYSKRDHETKTGKHVERIVSAEIMLPEHVPRQFADRQLLWNSVEAVEKQWNAQLCRRLIGIHNPKYLKSLRLDQDQLAKLNKLRIKAEMPPIIL